MDIQSINNLLSLDDEALRKKLTDAAVAAGADKNQIALALSDMNTLRRLARGLTPESIDSLLNSFGKENAKKVSEIIKNTN